MAFDPRVGPEDGDYRNDRAERNRYSEAYWEADAAARVLARLIVRLKIQAQADLAPGPVLDVLGEARDYARNALDVLREVRPFVREANIRVFD